MISFVSRTRFDIMNRLFTFILLIGILIVKPAFATMYMYTDDNGQVYYTNVLSSVPEDKRKDIIKFEEYEGTTPPENLSPDIREASPSSNYVDSFQKSQAEKNQEQRKKLEAEYNAALKEKEDLDNNISFQKRRKKRKYQNRPYIQELIKKEKQLIRQLSELEEKLKILEYKN